MSTKLAGRDRDRHREAQQRQGDDGKPGSALVQPAQHREVVQVHAVGDQSEPSQRCDREDRSEHGAISLHRRRDATRNGYRDKEKATSVHPGRHLDGHERDREQARDARQLEAHAQGAPAWARRQLEHECECRAEQQRLGPAVGSVVRTQRRPEVRHFRRGDQRESNDDADQEPAAASAQPREREEDRRPDQVPLLFDRQRPRVRERRRLGTGTDHVPVLDVEERGEPVRAGARQLLGRCREHRVEADDDQEHQQRRQQAADASTPELEERDVAGRRELDRQQRGDEVPRKDEEDVHAQEAAVAGAVVVAENGQHRDRAKPVQRRLVPETCVLDPAWLHPLAPLPVGREA